MEMDWSSASNDDAVLEQFCKDIEKFEKENPELCFLQGARPECSGIRNDVYHGGLLRRSDSEELYENLCAHQHKKEEYEKNPAAMIEEGYCELNGEIHRLDYALQKTHLKPDPFIVCQDAIQDDSQENSMHTFTTKVARGGPNHTSRGGGLRAYKFGRANRDGHDELSGFRVMTRLKDDPINPPRICNKRDRSPDMTDEELVAYRQQHFIPGTNKTKWTFGFGDRCIVD